MDEDEGRGEVHGQGGPLFHHVTNFHCESVSRSICPSRLGLEVLRGGRRGLLPREPKTRRLLGRLERLTPENPQEGTLCSDPPVGRDRR